MSLKRRTHTRKQNPNDVQCPSNVEHTPENKTPMMLDVPQTSNSHPKTKPNDVKYPSNVELTPENKIQMMFNVPRT
jgi:hypothetical protein